MTYLGKLVGQGQVKPVSAKVEAVAKFHPLVNASCGVPWECLNTTEDSRNFATVVAPLTDLLRTK